MIATSAAMRELPSVMSRRASGDRKKTEGRSENAMSRAHAYMLHAAIPKPRLSTAGTLRLATGGGARAADHDTRGGGV
jgi:hypothetical protein